MTILSISIKGYIKNFVSNTVPWNRSLIQDYLKKYALKNINVLYFDSNRTVFSETFEIMYKYLFMGLRLRTAYQMTSSRAL